MRSLLAATVASLLATAAPAQVPSVVTDTPVVESLVAQVMGSLGAPNAIVRAGADPHDFQLRPSQARSLNEAKAIFWIGPQMTPWLAPAVETSTASTKLSLLGVPGTEQRRYGDDNAAGGLDPHAWLDPDNARIWLLAIAEALAAEDGGNAATYRANAEQAAAEIAALDAKLRMKAKAMTKGIVTSHDAYAYFAAHFGIHVVASLSEGDAAQPGAARMTAIRELLQGGTVTCIFPEAGHDPKAIITLAEGTNVKVGAALDPEGSALDPGAGLYSALMTALVDRIVACAA